MQLRFYLDWNVISTFKRVDNLNDPDKTHFSALKDFVYQNKDKHSFLYSPAHLYDLIPSFGINNNLLITDLLNLSDISNDTLICQYWGNEEVIIHKRKVLDIFKDLIEERDKYTPTWLAHFIKMTRGEKFIKQKINSKVDFKGAENSYPIMKLIFPDTIRTKTEWSLIKDIMNLYNNINKDYSLFKGLKKFIIEQTKHKLQSSLLEGFNTVEKIEGFASFEENKIYKDLICKIQQDTISKDYSKFLRYYFAINLHGLDTARYEKGQPFKNIFNDSLHSFYASFCDYYITSDKGNLEKTLILYNDLKIKTKALTPSQFYNAPR